MKERWIIYRHTGVYIVELRTAEVAEEIDHVVVVDTRMKLLYDGVESGVMHLTGDALASSVGVLNAPGVGRSSWGVFYFRLLSKMEVEKGRIGGLE